MRIRCLILVPLLLACEQSGSPTCPVGQAGCACTPEGLCLEGLSCLNEMCQADISEESPTTSGTDVTTAAESTEAPDTTDSSVDSSSESPCQSPSIECDGICIDPLSDEQNCGECGKECIIEGEYGGCMGGECLPSLSECVSWDNPIPCSDVCSQSGEVCAELGCDGFTYIAYGSLETCADLLPQGFSSDPCTEPDFATNGAYRCCCAQ